MAKKNRPLSSSLELDECPLPDQELYDGIDSFGMSIEEDEPDEWDGRDYDLDDEDHEFYL